MLGVGGGGGVKREEEIRRSRVKEAGEERRRRRNGRRREELPKPRPKTRQTTEYISPSQRGDEVAERHTLVNIHTAGL